MAEKSLEVKISADVTSLKSQIAVAKAETSGFESAIRSLAKQAVSASGDMKASIEAELLKTVELADNAKAHLASLQGQMSKLTEEASSSGGAFAKLNESFLGVGEAAESITGKITQFTGVFGKIGELAAVGFGAEWIGEQINQVGELGEAYAQLQEKTGASLEQLGGLRLAAMETGTDFDQVGNGLRSLGSRMQDAVIHPSGEAAQAFKALGISVTDSSGQLLPVVDVFVAIAAAMATLQDGTAKTAIAGDLLGTKFGSALIPVLNKTGEGFTDLEERAKSYGLTLSDESVEASEKFESSQKDVGAALFGLKEVILGSNLPAFTALNEEFVTAAQDGGLLKDAAYVLEYGLKGLVDVSVAVVTAVSEIADGLTFVGQVMGNVILVADGLAHALDGDFAFAKASVKVATTAIADDWTDMLQKMKTQEQLFTDTENALWSATPQLAPATTMKTLAEHQGTADQPAPQLTPSASAGGGRGDGGRAQQDQMTEIAQDASEARKQIMDSEYQAQVSVWDTEVAQGKISKAQEIQDEMNAQNQMYQAQLQELQQEAAADAQGTAQKAKALDDIAVLTAQHNAEIAKMNEELADQQIEDARKVQEEQQQAAEATARAWQQAFQPIGTAFDSSINGVLQGTETLQSAELKAAQSITLAYIDAAAKKVISWVGSEAMILAQGIATQTGLTAAVTTGTATRLAVENAGRQTGKAMELADGTATINNDAYKAAAGAYSAVAGVPIVGPVLAPAAAVAAYAGVMAFDVLSAAGGAVIPAGVNPLVQLHENEMVLPSYIAQPITSMLQSANSVSNSNSSTTGDTTLHFNQVLNGVGSDVAGMVKNANQAVMSQLIDLTRNGTLRLPGR